VAGGKNDSSRREMQVVGGSTIHIRGDDLQEIRNKRVPRVRKGFRELPEPLSQLYIWYLKAGRSSLRGCEERDA